MGLLGVGGGMGKLFTRGDKGSATVAVSWRRERVCFVSEEGKGSLCVGRGEESSGCAKREGSAGFLRKN